MSPGIYFLGVLVLLITNKFSSRDGLGGGQRLHCTPDFQNRFLEAAQVCHKLS